MVRVLQLDSLDALDDYRLVWRNLLGQTRGATFFQSLDWLEPYWRHHQATQQPRVLLVEGNEGWLGILPLNLRLDPTNLGTYRVLAYPHHDWGTFFGPIGPHPTATLLSSLSHLKRGRQDWDLIDLRWIDRTGIDASRTAMAFETLSMPAVELEGQPAATVTIDGDWPGYWQARDTHFRKNVERSRRRLEAQGCLNYVRYRPGGFSVGETDPRWDLYDVCQRLAGASWQGSSKTGTTLSHVSVQDYLREAHTSAVWAGAADINLLYLGDQPAAFAYCYQYEGNVFGLRMGFDPHVSREGSGSVLLELMLEDSFRRGDRHFDLGTGYLSVKRHWHTALVPTYHYTHFASGQVRAQALRIGRWARRQLRHFAG